ncbi:MAG: polymer-forming cytoskeletal protein [Anaerolineales bacterium]|jgi:cytoskeletal protein CcmA (bactofilin family)
MSDEPRPQTDAPERVDSVLGQGIQWQGKVVGTGGVRIDGAFEGEIKVRGIVVIGVDGRVVCDEIRATTVVVSGSLEGNVMAQRVEITATGRVYGDVTVVSFSTEEGAFLRGNITMEDSLELGLPQGEAPLEAEVEQEQTEQDEQD